MLDKGRIKGYWKERAERQGRRTVGYAGTATTSEDRRYEKRKKLIFKRCPRDLVTLDYGCGTGRYAYEFEDYRGVDITPKLLEHAREDNPGKEFTELTDPWLPPPSELNVPPIELFFTATVLQHNSDEVVDKILASLVPHAAPGIIFCMYENAEVIKEHVKARSPRRYAEMAARHFPVAGHKAKCHRIHKEKHCCVLVTTQ
jgi:SAM-dependent methyltransferase